MSHRRHSRRRFIKTAAAFAAASGLPLWYADHVLAQDADAKKDIPPPNPSNLVSIGLVGCGGMGRGDAKNASRFGKVIAVCDLDKSHIAEAQKEHPGAKAYDDFRKLVEQKDIDIVICATVDHWHTLVSMAAMKAGKDVYCEKPLTLTIDEGKHLVKVKQETNRVLQTGTQQRSDIRFRLACNLVRAGRIGKLQHVDVWIPAGRREGPFKPTEVPDGFNWEMWKGQTPDVEYVKERTHLTFRYWWEYSGGTVTDWGAHHNDIVLWCTGNDRPGKGPVSVEGKPLIDMIPGGFTATAEYELNYTYPDGLTHTVRSTKGSAWHGGTVNGPDGKPIAQVHGIKFIGSDGWLWVTRGNIDASNKDILKQKLDPSQEVMYVSNDHWKNFIDCVKSRKDPIAPAEVGHVSATSCHLGTMAIRLGRKINWDPANQQIVGDDQASRMMSREMRKPWDYSCI
jgi:predicted dehydrogenase